MKKSRNRINKTPGILGVVCFFLLVAGISTIVIMTYAAVSDKLGENRAAIAGIMFAVIAAVSVLCTVVDFVRRKYSVYRPVNQILQATDDIAQGKFDTRLTPKHSFKYYDEYDYIMENFNKMAEELSKSEVLKTDFISNVSHELKTPLAVIQSYAALLKYDDLPAEKRTEYADTLISASARLNNLVVNILSLNKLENQQITAPAQEVRLDEMLAQSVLNYEEIIERKNIDFNCDLDEITVLTQPNYLEIVWNNLVSNALKFTPEGGKVNVSLRADNGYAVVAVSDTGCGISAETGRHIFDKFYQGDTSHSKEGNGLGLALVKKVIDVLGGEITVQSEVNKGSVFTVRLKGVVNHEK